MRPIRNPVGSEELKSGFSETTVSVSGEGANIGEIHSASAVASIVSLAVAISAARVASDLVVDL